MEPFRHHNAHGGPAVTINYGPSPADIKRQQKKALARPSFLRIAIRLITLAVGATVLAVLLQSIIVWYSTRNTILSQPNGLRMKGWPTTMNMTPTYVMLGAAVMSVVVQVGAALTLINGVRRLREAKLHTWTVFATSVVGICIWIAAAGFFKSQDVEGGSNWTLWTWACQHKDLRNGKVSFEAMCIRLNLVFYAAIVVGLLEVTSLLLFGHRLRKIKKEGGGAGYTKITIENR